MYSIATEGTIFRQITAPYYMSAPENAAKLGTARAQQQTQHKVVLPQTIEKHLTISRMYKIDEVSRVIFGKFFKKSLCF